MQYSKVICNFKIAQASIKLQTYLMQTIQNGVHNEKYAIILLNNSDILLLLDNRPEVSKSTHNAL